MPKVQEKCRCGASFEISVEDDGMAISRLDLIEAKVRAWAAEHDTKGCPG